MACKCWCLICWHLMTEIGLINLSRLNALPRSVFQGQWMIDGSILFLSTVAGRQIAPTTGQMWLRRSSLVAIRGDECSNPPDCSLASLVMINGMYWLSAASPGAHLCEWASTAYMILHADITSNF